jgi:hypothetical protein
MDSLEPEAGAQQRHGVPTYVVEAAVAAILLVLALVVAQSSLKLGAGWTTDGPGSGYFPFYIGVILAISSAGTLYQALLGKKRNTAIFVDAEQFKRVLVVLLPALVYVGAIALVGVYIASAVYIAGFMIVLGKFHYAKSVAIGVITAVLFFLMFEVWFKVPLFKGVFDPLAFLGY